MLRPADAPDVIQRLDILESIFSDTAWLASQHVRALASADEALWEVAQGLERRLWAHLDALIVAHPEATRALCEPALSSDEPGEPLCAAAILLAQQPELARASISALLEDEDTEPAVAAELALAVGRSGAPDVTGWIEALLPRTSGATRAALLDALVAARAEPRARLDGWLRDPSPEVRCAALRAGRRYPTRVDPVTVDEVLADRHPSVVAEAIRTGLTLGSRRAWERCAAVVSGREPGSEAGWEAAWEGAAVVFALGGGEPAVAPLIAQLADPARGPGAARALGASGLLSAADALVAAMEDEALAPVAFDAFRAITGLSAEDPFALAEERVTDETLASDAAPAQDEADALPVPVPAEVQRWWKAKRTEFSPATRLLRGVPFTPDALVAAISSGPLSWAPVHALELQVRSRNEQCWTPAGWARTQLEEARSLRPALVRDATRPFTAVLQGGAFRALPRAAVATPRLSPVRSPAGSVSPEALAITAMGMVSSCGEGVLGSCAAALAGLAFPSPLELTAYDSDEAEPVAVNGHLVPSADGFVGVGRFAVLATRALTELAARQGPVAPGTRTGLFVALPSLRLPDTLEREGWDEKADGPFPEPTDALRLRGMLEKELPPVLARAATPLGALALQEQTFTDAVGFLQALQAAGAALMTRKIDRAIVGGVDSLSDPALLSQLETAGMLKTVDRSVGFMPGEAAAFVTIERAADARRRGAPIQALLGAAAVRAEGQPTVHAPWLGRALAQAVAEVMRAPATATPWVIASLNGSVGRAQDWGHAKVRLQGPVADAPESLPVVSFGELGAATGPVAVCLAARAFARGMAPAAQALIWLWNELGERGALAVHAPLEGGENDARV